MISSSNFLPVLAYTKKSDPLSHISTQSRLHCPQQHFCTAKQVSLLIRRLSFLTIQTKRRLPGHLVHSIRSPRKEGQRLHAIADRPSNLNPQHQPITGRNKPTPGTSSLCHLMSFKTPSSEKKQTTRILHHSQKLPENSFVQIILRQFLWELYYIV